MLCSLEGALDLLEPSTLALENACDMLELIAEFNALLVRLDFIEAMVFLVDRLLKALEETLFFAKRQQIRQHFTK